MKVTENSKKMIDNKRFSDDPNNLDNSKDYSSITKNNFVPSNNLDYLIKKLVNPGFLGSIHLKKEMNPNYRQVEKLLVNEHELELTRSLKNSIFNPITKILIISAIIFNLIWLLSIYLI
ncbi:MAG: hypothetical protein ACFFG0_45405 [Candidatus Thorarchaeota archaeon]